MWVVIVLIAIAVIAAFVFFLRQGTRPSRTQPAAMPAPASTPPAVPRYPISEANAPASASTAPLPPLNASDALVLDALSSLPGADGLRDLLLKIAIIPHFVATVDALPRHTIGSSILPLRVPSGHFLIAGTNGQQTIDAGDYARYDAYMHLVENLDTRALVAWYVHDYPLFQQAYRELGYPSGYFNDRLIESINDMLAAPNANAPVAVLPTGNGHYVFADPTWESLSVGQKLMIRLGPENEATLKTKLREIRTALLGKLPAAGAPLPSAASTGAPLI